MEFNSYKLNIEYQKKNSQAIDKKTKKILDFKFNYRIFSIW